MWILTGSEPLEIHSYFFSSMLLIVDLQCITTRKVKSGCALNKRLRPPQSRESAQNSLEFGSLPRQVSRQRGMHNTVALIDYYAKVSTPYAKTWRII